MHHFDAEGVKPPEKPYHVRCVDVSHIPTLIRLTFDEVHERFQCACNYWRTTHRLRKDEYLHIDLFGGRSMIITKDMLLAFESWLVFDKPRHELYDIAFIDRKNGTMSTELNNMKIKSLMRGKKDLIDFTMKIIKHIM